MNPKPARRHARQIFEAALAAAEPRAGVLAHLRREGETLLAGRRRYDLGAIDRIWLIGAGKASAPMAQAVEKVLGRRIAGGCIVVKDGHGAPLARVELCEASHPVPDERGLAAAERIAGIAREAGPRDLVICCLSGGASALLPLPAPGLSLAEKQRVTRLLLACGANIHEMNATRKHLSAIKGGQLAQLAAPARVLTLILSDVIGDDLATIGSGPTAPDPSTRAEVEAIFARYGLSAELPPLPHETPKPGDPLFARVENLLIGSNAQSIEAAARRARELGYRSLVLSTTIEGETREVARMHAQIALESVRTGRPGRAPLCLLSGGETTVQLGSSPGLGGRNQEFALAVALEIAGEPSIVALSAGTDGTDGPTDAAGAWADGGTTERAPGARAALDGHNAYPYLEATGDLLRTGPTRTNVMDIRILLVSPAAPRKAHRPTPLTAR